MSNEREEEVRESQTELEELIEKIDEHPFGIITRRGYQELKKQISDYSEKIEDRFHRWFVMSLVAFAIISTATGIALVGFSLVLTKQSDVTQKIQDQRYGAVLDGCLDANGRHLDFVRELEKAVAHTPKSRRKRAEAGAKPFKAILAAAVPFTDDCRKFARDRVQGGSPE